MEGTVLKEINPAFEKVAREHGFYSDAMMEEIARRGSLRGVAGVPDEVRRVFVTDQDIAPDWHVRMQAAFQKHTDNSVSKTVNLPRDSSPEDILRVYQLAHELKCKGITAYRYGSRTKQVLYLGGHEDQLAERLPYTTADTEYSGGCHVGSCPA